MLDAIASLRDKAWCWDSGLELGELNAQGMVDDGRVGDKGWRRRQAH
jgi:hypothetical protein